MRRTLFVAVALAGCSASQPTTELHSSLTRITNPNVPTTDSAALVSGMTTFAANLHRTLATASGNLFYSPYSISIDLAMFSDNANTGTQASIAATLDFTLPEAQLDPAFDALDLALESRQGKQVTGGSGQQLKTANAIWSAYQPPATYLNTLAQYYGAGVLVGQTAGEAISQWQQSNKGSLPALPFQLAEPCDNAVVNLVTLDAAFDQPFDPNATQPADFRRLDGTTVSVPFMNGVISLPYAAQSGVRTVQLPYAGGALSLLIVVPDDLATFEANLGGDGITNLVQSLSPTTVQLSLPKFTFKSSWSVLDQLQQMGLQLQTGGVSQIWHSAEIVTSENGTQAAAMTVYSHSPSAVLQGTPFTIDQPFLLFIRDSGTGAVVFAGRIVDPSQTG